MSGSNLLGLIRNQARGQLPSGIELATVVSPPPALKIRLDNMSLVLEGDDLIVCEHLLEHQRSYSTTPVVAGSNVSQWADTSAPTHSHTHQVEGLTITNQSMTIHTKLMVGTRVAVMALPGGQQYLVWDKVVTIDG